MQRSKFFIVAGVIFGFLAGCGSSDPALTLQEQFENDGESAIAMAARLDSLSNSAFSIFPGAGQVTYSGYAVVGAETPDETTELLGDAILTADFDSSVVTGSMTNFVGATAPLSQSTTPAVANYAGTLTLSNGLVDGPNRPNQFGADFSGTLTGQGNVIVLNGAMIGDFKGGSLRNGIVGASTDSATTATLNGATADGFMGVVAEADREF